MLIIENAGDDKLSILRHAIENKYEISFWYRGVKVSDPKEKKYTKQNWRYAQPVALGKSKATGKWMLRAYQTVGVTNSRNGRYKTFLVDEIKDGSIEILYDRTGREISTFTPASGYRTDGGDKKMDGERAINYTDSSKEPGSKDPKFRDVNYKEPKNNKPEDVESAENVNIDENHSSGFLKWIYKLNG